MSIDLHHTVHSCLWIVVDSTDDIFDEGDEVSRHLFSIVQPNSFCITSLRQGCPPDRTRDREGPSWNSPLDTKTVGVTSAHVVEARSNYQVSCMNFLHRTPISIFLPVDSKYP